MRKNEARSYFFSFQIFMWFIFIMKEGATHSQHSKMELFCVPVFLALGYAPIWCFLMLPLCCIKLWFSLLFTAHYILYNNSFVEQLESQLSVFNLRWIKLTFWSCILTVPKGLLHHLHFDAICN